MISLKSWQIRHKTIMEQYLHELNQQQDSVILKGGTALMLCYGLNRFSEDIDLDSPHYKLKEFTKRFCQKYGYDYRIAKDTQTVQRFMIHYRDGSKPLKVEISYRNKVILPNTYQKINDISVYTIDRLAQLKASAYQGRDKIRDLYDVCFICNNYYSELSESTQNLIRDALSFKGFEHFDYIVNTQSDPLIDKNQLAEDYLKMYDKLDLLYTSDEKNTLAQDKDSKHASHHTEK